MRRETPIASLRYYLDVWVMGLSPILLALIFGGELTSSDSSPMERHVMQHV